jgi:hypothetical protein
MRWSRSIAYRGSLLTRNPILAIVERMFDPSEVPSPWVEDYFDSLDSRTEMAVLDAESTLDEILHCEQIVAVAQARQIRALARFAHLHAPTAPVPR